MNKIWLSSPHMGGNEKKYIEEAFEKNWIAPLGPNVTHFEKDLENFLGNDVKVAALSSGTAALHLGLILLGVEKNDEVICQSMTFSASANPIIYQGAKPIFIDSEEKTWNLCPNALEEAIKDRINKGIKPKAIVAVHLYGMPYQHKEIKEISLRYDIPILEDSAEALGSSYNNQMCGTLGDISVLSFNGNKIITTSGGGALVTKNENLKNKAIFLATQARDEAPHYQHSHIGYNYRLSNVCAGIGRGQMEVVSKHVKQRRENHDFYNTILEDYPNIEVKNEPSEIYYSNFWLSTLLVNKEDGYICRETLRNSLISKYNIETRPLWKPMHLQPIFKDYPYYGSNIAESLFNKGLCLPSGSNLSNEEKERIRIALTNELKNV